MSPERSAAPRHATRIGALRPPLIRTLGVRTLGVRTLGVRALGLLTLGMLACGGASPGQPTSGSGTTTDARPTGSHAATTGDAQTSVDSTSDTAHGSTTATTDATSSSTGTPLLGAPYPIVLAHGFFGFDSLAGLDALNYFFGVTEALSEAGEDLVFTPAVDPFNDSTVRGLQLLAQVEAITARTGYAKVVLVGHSQGGVDARLVANLRPDLVAAVITIATPHLGTPVADVALGLVEDPNAAAVIDALVNAAGVGLWDEVDGGSSLALSMQQLSRPGMAAFNATVPNAPTVRYISIAGRSSLSLGGATCDPALGAPPFITDWVNQRDPIDALFAATATFLSGNPLAPTPNDGLVVVQDAVWGEFLGCIPADHPDQIGQVLGDLPGVFNQWRHEPFYVALAAWIRTEGL